MMTDRQKLSVKGVWLIAGLASVILPVFLPTLRDGSLADSPIGIATLTMFALSFPSSILAMISAAFIQFILGIDSWSLAGKYLNVLMLFGFGVLQWFWIAPRIFRFNRMIERLDSRETGMEPSLADARESAACGVFHVNETTPLERVLKDDK